MSENKQFDELIAVADAGDLSRTSEGVDGPCCGHPIPSSDAGPRCPGEAAQPQIGDPAPRGQMVPQRLGTHGGQFVGAPAVVALDRRNQALSLQSAQCLEERARGEADVGEALDVLGEGVAVLGAFGQAREDERGRSGVAPEALEASGPPPVLSSVRSGGEACGPVCIG